MTFSAAFSKDQDCFPRTRYMLYRVSLTWYRKACTLISHKFYPKHFRAPFEDLNLILLPSDLANSFHWAKPHLVMTLCTRLKKSIYFFLRSLIDEKGLNDNSMISRKFAG